MLFTNRLLAYRQPEYVESNQYVSAILQKDLEKIETEHGRAQDDLIFSIIAREYYLIVLFTKL